MLSACLAAQNAVFLNLATWDDPVRPFSARQVGSYRPPADFQDLCSSPSAAKPRMRDRIRRLENLC